MKGNDWKRETSELKTGDFFLRGWGVALLDLGEN